MDPSTGGHLTIESPSTASHTALFDRVEIYPEDIHDARGSSVCGPDERWLNVVISKSLDERVFEAVHSPTMPGNTSDFVADALEAYLEEVEHGDD
jgi:hypothetical protein